MNKGHAITILLQTAIAVWQLVAFVRSILRTFDRNIPRSFQAIFFELKPFMVPLIVAAFLAESITHPHTSYTWRVFGLACNLLNYAVYRKDDDDDRWKRRRKKLAEKVSVANGRLTVVPVEGK